MCASVDASFQHLEPYNRTLTTLPLYSLKIGRMFPSYECLLVFLVVLQVSLLRLIKYILSYLILSYLILLTHMSPELHIIPLPSREVILNFNV